MWADIGLILGAYFLGSIPHLLLLARLRHVSLDGDFHENLWNNAGKTFGVIGVLGEFAKGAIPVLVGYQLDFSLAVIVIAGLAVVCGQMWPLFSRFDGEKGNSIAIAMMVVLTPVPALLSIVAVVLSLLIRIWARLTSKSSSPGDKAIIGGSYSRSLPLGMLIFFLSLPFTAWFFGEPVEIIWCGAVLFVLIMGRRITAGLRRDLRERNDVKSILLSRLFYDRAAVRWRK